MAAQETKTITLEKGARFSKSLIWEYQKEYFASQGINAWIGSVPFYVTSNALIANDYAQIVARFIQDQVHNQTLNTQEPIYIFELGTGTGKFSYLFLVCLTKLLKQLQLDHLKYCYVMTDFTEQNLQYWQNHAQLKPFVEQGVLDFAIYNIGQDARIHLVNRNIWIAKGSCVNPVAVIANYVFDTITHDAFNVTNKFLREGLLDIKTPSTNLDENKKVINLESLQTNFTFEPVKMPYYGDAQLNNILDYYTQHIHEGTFLIPIGALQAINNLRSFANGNLFVIAGDKAYTSIKSLEKLATPHIAFHGSFSMMVNFDAIARYVEGLGGSSELAFDSDGFKINLFFLGDKLKHVPETRVAYQNFTEHFSTRDFLPLKNKVLEYQKSCNLTELIALLKFSYWDPDILMSIASSLAEQLRTGSSGLRNECHAGLQKIYDNFYFLPNKKNVLFELGYLYHILNDHHRSRDLYQESLLCFGEDAATYFNLGLCNYNLKHHEEALICFEKTLAIDPNYQLAKEWIEFVKKEM